MAQNNCCVRVYLVGNITGALLIPKVKKNSKPIENSATFYLTGEKEKITF